MKLMNFLPSEMFAAELQHLNHSQISRLFKLWFAMMMGDDSLQTVSEVASVLLEMPAFDRAADYLKKDPDCATLIQERYIPASYNLDQLLTYAPDSLGYQFAVAMKKVGFDPD
ncbi:MAG: ubiquinone biosynthesis protein, partial [Cyanobacteria bacterium J06636_16]